MALVKSKILPSGIELPEAYFNIKNVSLDYVTETAYIELLIYKDKQSRIANLTAVESLTIPVYSESFADYYSIENMNDEGVNVVKVSYEYLKTLEMFEGAIDDI